MWVPWWPVLRDALQAALKAQGIPSMVYYPRAMHEQTAFQTMGYQRICPTATSLCQRVLSLPMHPYMTEADITTICNAIKSALSQQ